MNKVSQLKVLKSKAGYYLGRTINENGVEKPYDRKTDFMSKSNAENLLKNYEKELGNRINEVKKDLSIRLGVDFGSIKPQHVVAFDNEKGSKPIVLELRPKLTDFEKMLFQQESDKKHTYTRNVTDKYLSEDAEGKTVQQFINRLKDLIDGKNIELLKKNLSFGYNEDVLMFLEDKYKIFDKLSLTTNIGGNQLLLEAKDRYRLYISLDLNQERYKVMDRFGNDNWYKQIKDGPIQELSISRNKQLEVFHEGKQIGNLEQVLTTDRFKILRSVPEILEISKAIEKDAREQNTKQIAVGSIDVNNQLVSKKILDLTDETGEKERFIEAAVTFFHSVIPLSKDEFQSINVGDKITRNSYEKTIKPREKEKSLER